MSPGLWIHNPDPPKILPAAPHPAGGGGGLGQPKMCIPPGKLLGTPLVVSEPDPYVFGPPGSGSNSTRYWYGSGSGSFYNKAKVVRKTLIPPVLRLFFDFLSLKNDVSVASKCNKQKNFEKK